MKRIRCKRCGHPAATRSIATDGRPKYRCDRCGDWWTQGYPDSKRKRKWDKETAVPR